MRAEHRLESGHALVDDRRLHYVAAGEADDPLVVLLHGFPEFWYSWRHQLVALADAGFRAVALDMRGYNRSEKPHGEGDYGMAELVGDVMGLIEYFDREEARIAGHDWGAMIAWEAAIRHPETVEQLAALNTPHPSRLLQVSKRNPEQWRRSWYMGLFQLPWLPEALLGSFDAFGVGKMIELTAKPDTVSDADLRRYREAADRPGAVTSSLNYYRQALRDIISRELRSMVGLGPESLDVAVPALIIWGEQDAFLTVEMSEGHEQWVSDLRVERLPEASHWVQNDRPEEVSRLLTEFFER